MKNISTKFKEGIDNPNTNITPVLTIGKHNPNGRPMVGAAITVSTKLFSRSTMSMDFTILPLLKDFP